MALRISLLPLGLLQLPAIRLRGCRCGQLMLNDAQCSQLLSTIQDSIDLGGRLAELAQPGDTILLRGDYGSGKTCLARGFIRRWFDQVDELVTSPSYLIDNVYPDDGRARCTGVTVHHMDLWRLPEGKIDQLVDLKDIFSNCVSLIEWPERLGDDLMPKQYLSIHLAIVSDSKEDSGGIDEADFEDDRPRVASFEAKGSQWLNRLPALLASE